MSSINTNIAAMTALQSLNKTNSELLTTQNRISTGLRVQSASDNAAYWSIATTMRSDRAAVSTVVDNLGLGAATADVASKGVDTAISIAGKIKDKLVSARTPGLDRAKIQTEITQLQSSLKDAVEGATFSGQNWLAVDSTGTTTRTLVSSFSRDGAGAVSIGTISVDVGATGTMLIDTSAAGATGILDKDRPAGAGTFSVLGLNISALTDSTADLTTIENYVKGVDAAITEMTKAGTNLGAIQTRINLQKDFAGSIMDAIDKGVGQLVDADMNQESTRLQALQVRQQLSVQALSIANQSSQSILSLFR